MHLNDPDGVDERYPGKKKIKRARLKAHGTWQELHCDGHEKLGALALQMGGVGLPIYAMRDKWGPKFYILKSYLTTDTETSLDTSFLISLRCTEVRTNLNHHSLDSLASQQFHNKPQPTKAPRRVSFTPS
jgi:hypothetical protein